MTNPEAVEQLVLLLPKDQLIDRLIDNPRVMVQRFNSTAGVSRLAYELMNSTFRELPEWANAAPAAWPMR